MIPLQVEAEAGRDRGLRGVIHRFPLGECLLCYVMLVDNDK